MAAVRGICRVVVENVKFETNDSVCGANPMNISAKDSLVQFHSHRHFKKSCNNKKNNINGGGKGN